MQLNNRNRNKEDRLTRCLPYFFLSLFLGQADAGYLNRKQIWLTLQQCKCHFRNKKNVSTYIVSFLIHKLKKKY